MGVPSGFELAWQVRLLVAGGLIEAAVIRPVARAQASFAMLTTVALPAQPSAPYSRTSSGQSPDRSQVQPQESSSKSGVTLAS
jgi:hypothetical protein